jgi:hypothetical protein
MAESWASAREVEKPDGKIPRAPSRGWELGVELESVGMAGGRG